MATYYGYLIECKHIKYNYFFSYITRKSKIRFLDCTQLIFVLGFASEFNYRLPGELLIL